MATLATLTLAVALAALGSAPRWAACLSAALAIVTALPLLSVRRAQQNISPLLWLLAVAAGLTALELIPWPMALVDALSPELATLARDNAAALGRDAPGFLSLSYDPPATWVELAKLAGYLAFAVATTRLAISARGQAWLASSVAGCGVAMAVCAVIHGLLGLDALFGVYQRQANPPRHHLIAPLLNENHLAGFLSFTVPLCLVLAISATGTRRILWIVGAILAAGVTLSTESRGGAVALAVGVIATAILVTIQRRRESGRKPRRRKLAVLLPASVVLASVIVMLVALTGGGVRDELAATSTAELAQPTSKPGIWLATRALIQYNVWTGVGRGAFEVAFTRFHATGVKTYSHVENEPLQAIADWGIPGAAALALLFLWTAVLALRRWDRGLIEIGAVSALGAIVLQNLVDFNLELPGVALAVLACVALLLPQKLEKGTAPRSERLPRRLLFGALLAVLAGVVAVAASPVGRSFRAEGDELAARLDAADRAKGEERVVIARQAIAPSLAAWQRHPSDYVLAGLAAKAHFQAGDERALRLMNRALSLNMRHPGLHVLTARMLLQGQHAEQALIEMSLALEYTDQPRTVLRDLVRWFPLPEQAARGMPVAPERVAAMIRNVQALGRAEARAASATGTSPTRSMQHYIDVAVAYARRAVRENENNIQVLEQAADLGLTSGAVDLAILAGKELAGRRGRLADRVAYGRALQAAGRLDEARAVLVEAASTAKDVRGELLTRRLLYLTLGDVELSLGHHREARDSLQEAVALTGTGEPAELASIYRKLAAIETALGNADLAGEMRKRAIEFDATRQNDR